MSDGLPPGGDGAIEDELPTGSTTQAQDGGAPASNGVDRDEAAFEATGRSRREDRRIQQLLRERAELRTQVGTLQQQRDAAIRAVNRSTAQTIDGDIQAVQARLKQAFLDGDGDAHTLAQTQLASLVARREAMASQPQTPTGPQQAAVSAETQEWIGRNPRFNSDDAWRGEALKAHEAAVHLGYAVDEPDYFRFVEDQIERRFPGTVARSGNEVQQEQEQSVTTGYAAQQTTRPGYRAGPAPVNRAPMRPGGASRVADTIPANMRANVEMAAKASGQPVEKYWATARKLAAAGQMNLDAFKA